MAKIGIAKQHELRGGILLSNAHHKIMRVMGEGNVLVFNIGVFKDRATLESADGVPVWEYQVRMDVNPAVNAGLLDSLYDVLASAPEFQGGTIASNP